MFFSPTLGKINIVSYIKNTLCKVCFTKRTFMIQKEIMLENRQEVERQHVVKRDIVIEDFANYVLIGVRRAAQLSFQLRGALMLFYRMGCGGVTSPALLWLRLQPSPHTRLRAGQLWHCQRLRPPHGHQRHTLHSRHRRCLQ